jgi:hypothetical protein
VIQLWRNSGYLLGVDEELLCASEPEARWLVELACFSTNEPDQHSRELLDALFESRFQTPIGGLRWPMATYKGLARELVGDDLADRLGLPRTWHGPLLLAGVRTIVPILELTRRIVPGMNALATAVGDQLWSRLLESDPC